MIYGDLAYIPRASSTSPFDFHYHHAIYPPSIVMSDCMSPENGYAKVARLMSLHEEFAIFRRFKQENYQNLLLHLRPGVAGVAQQDRAQPDRAIYDKDWWSLSHGID